VLLFIIFTIHFYSLYYVEPIICLRGRTEQYNCNDFKNNSAAQYVFEYCNWDTFGLDSDGDGIACNNNEK